MNKRIEGFSERLSDGLSKKSILEMLGLKKKTTMAATVFRSVGLLGLGAAAGLVVGLLLAPRSGRATREHLGRRVKQGALRAADRAQDFLEATQMAGA